MANKSNHLTNKHFIKEFYLRYIQVFLVKKVYLIYNYKEKTYLSKHIMKGICNVTFRCLNNF